MSQKKPTYDDIYATIAGIDFSAGTSEEARGQCPFCQHDGEKFYVNEESGQFHCKHCPAHGGKFDFITMWYDALPETPDDLYRELGRDRRGIPISILKKFGLTWHPGWGCWLIPFWGKVKERNKTRRKILTVQKYFPGAEESKKMLWGYSVSLYNADRLPADKSRTVYLCEGPFDAIALDWRFGNKRGRYGIVAAATGFQKGWAEQLRDRHVITLFDNDEGGRDHRKAATTHLLNITDKLEHLKWPDSTVDGFDLSDWICSTAKQKPKPPVVSFINKNKVQEVREPQLVYFFGKQPEDDDPEDDFIWENRLPCSTYVSFSGPMGTSKSQIAADIAARYSSGRPMPREKKANMPAGKVLYLGAEDARKKTSAAFERHGGNFDNWIFMAPVTKSDKYGLNILQHLQEIEELVEEHKIRLVIIDGQNSVVGAPNISTDMKARNAVTNRMHRLAERMKVCLIGMRNEDDEGRALGPASMSHLARCVMHSVKLKKESSKAKQYCQLIFEKVSDRDPALYSKPIGYTVKSGKLSHRTVDWFKRPPKTKDEKTSETETGKTRSPTTTARVNAAIAKASTKTTIPRKRAK